jgi:hypothetical protein
VIKDIDTVHRHVEALRTAAGSSNRLTQEAVQRLSREVPPDEMEAFHAALNWYAGGLRSVFLQDANSLIIKPKDLIDILRHLKKRFPWIQRITSYARSHTIARISDDDLKTMRESGLNRIHIGLESGSDKVLQRVKKGVDKATHIKAGQKVKRAGMELSEYVMPGLGGRDLSRDHALETADALNRIDPDFIRMRTLAIPNHVELYEAYQSGEFEKCTDYEMVREIKLFIETLDGIHATLKSDHILNLFQELEGKLPDDKPKMLAVLQSFLDMTPEDRVLYQVGRRLGIFTRLSDMESPRRRERAEKTCREFGITPENADAAIDELMKRFI